MFMAQVLLSLSFSLLAITLHQLFQGSAAGSTITLVNQCEYTVWPGILSNAGSPPLSTTGFALQKGRSMSVNTPSDWGGRFWGRTLCATDSTTGRFTCQTGDCGSGRVDCAGDGAAPPATLAEFKIAADGSLDYYDVSLVDGYNLPMLVVPGGGGGRANCSSTGCVADLNGACPPELRVMSLDGSESVACKSACGAFDQPKYCCSGAYATPVICKPTSYSEKFKRLCPRAYSYAYDDPTSTFTCRGSGGYTITFCPSPATGQKASADQATTSTSPASESSSSSIGGGMVFQGELDTSSLASSSPSTCTDAVVSRLCAGSVAILIAIRLSWQQLLQL